MFIRALTFAIIATALLGIRPVSAASPGDAVINELLWMGSSLSSSDEWIELRNTTAAAIDLSGWTLTKLSSDQTQPMVRLPAGASIPAGGFFLIANFAETHASSALAVTPNLVDSAVSLVNSKLQVMLLDAAGQVVDVADDGSGAPLAGHYVSGSAWQSMERNRVPGDGTLETSWHTATVATGFKAGPELGTPGAANSNQPPVVTGLADVAAAAGEVIAFDVSESSDPDGDPLTFSWQFGDGTTGTGPTPTHSYSAAGTYTITVTASDGLSSTSATATATITRQEPNLPAIPKPIQPAKPDPPVLPADLNVPKPPLLEPIRPGQLGLRFSEVFPDPEGLDAGVEYLELFHAGAEALSTAGWSVTNLKRAFTLPQTSLEPGDYLVLQGAALGLQLRNLGDTLYLVSPDGAIRDGVKYPKAKTGQSFSRFTKRWAWTEASAGEDNVKPEDGNKESGIGDQRNGDELPFLRIDEARLTEAGQKFALEGTVVVAMGALDERQILLGDASGTMVIGFDQSVDLAVGDRIRVAVRRSTAKEPRALAKVADLERRGRGGLVEPVAATIESLSDDNLGALVAVEGVVTVTRATSFTLDDETGQLSVQWAGASDLERDARVAVTGVVRSSSGRLRLIGVEVVEVVEESAPLVAGATVEAPAAAPAPTVPVPTAASTPSPLGFVLMGFAGLLIVVRLLVLPRLA